MSVPVEFVNLRSCLSDINGGEFCCIGLCPVLVSREVQDFLVCRS